MKYPMLSNYVELVPGKNGNQILRGVLTGEEISLDPYTADFIRQLDGKTDPYAIDPSLGRERVSRLLEAMDRCDFLRYSRRVDMGPGGQYFTLWFTRFKPGPHPAAALYNGLILLWPLWLLLGFRIFWRSLPFRSVPFAPFYGILGVLAGVMFHELGHLSSGLTYGARVLEMGVGLESLLPMAYVIQNADSVPSRLKQAQIDAAGAEANFSLAGLLLALCGPFPGLNMALFCAALGNLMDGITNLCFWEGLDGRHVIGNLLGIHHLDTVVSRVTRRPGSRRALMRHGPVGLAVILICYILRFFSWGVPLMLIINLLGVIL